MRVALKKDFISGQWEVEVIKGSHNHLAFADPFAFLAHKLAALDPEIEAKIETVVCFGLSNAHIRVLM